MSLRRLCIRFWLGILLGVAVVNGPHAQAGPPLVTDDPETPGRHGWEVNVSNNIEKTADQLTMDIPKLDLNYGLLENDQWKLEVPLRFVEPDGGEGTGGVGDVLLGWKYRFRDEDKSGYMISIYPQVLVPTGNPTTGVGDGYAELLLPVEVGKHFCQEKLFVYAEAGYNIVFGQSENDAWKFGLAVEAKATEKLKCLVEVGDYVFPGGGEPDNPFFNAGVKYQFTDRVAFIGAAGRSFLDRSHGVPEFTSYLGLQFTWGGKEKTGEEQKPEETKDGNQKAIRTEIPRNHALSAH